MYNVLDVRAFPQVNVAVRRRNRPVKPFGSTILLRPKADINLIPPNSEIKCVRGHWEVHTPLTNKRIVKRLAKELNAIAWLVEE